MRLGDRPSRPAPAGACSVIVLSSFQPGNDEEEEAVRRALLGGTFDPIHIAHLVAGEIAFRTLQVDVVTFLPAGVPWQKLENGFTEAQHRWEMTKLAIEGVDYFEADDREVTRDGWTFTADTLASFPSSDELWLVLGADAAANLPTWHRVEEVVRRAKVAVVPRPGVDVDRVHAAVPDVVWLDMPELQLSGTELRGRVAAGASVRFLVRDAVWEYIESHRLYRAPPEA